MSIIKIHYINVSTFQGLIETLFLKVCLCKYIIEIYFMFGPYHLIPYK